MYDDVCVKSKIENLLFPDTVAVSVCNKFGDYAHALRDRPSNLSISLQDYEKIADCLSGNRGFFLTRVFSYRNITKYDSLTWKTTECKRLKMNKSDGH